MLDLFHTLQDLQVWGISLVAQTGLQFDLRRAQGKLIASLMAALAEFERDLLRERVRSGIAAVRDRVVVFGRRPGQRIKVDRYATKVLKLVDEGQSYREISHRLAVEQGHRSRYRQAQPRGPTLLESLACLKFRFVSSPLMGRKNISYVVTPRPSFLGCSRG